MAAQKLPQVPSKRKAAPVSGSESDGSDEAAGSSAMDEQEEEEFHTDDDMSGSSDDLVDDSEGMETSDSEDEDAQAANRNTTTPLLPASLLKAHPQARSAHISSLPQDVPRNISSLKENKTQRNRSRQAKKRLYDRLRRHSEGTGTLEAGQAAQIRRGVFASQGARQVQKARAKKMQKRTPVKKSGREMKVQERKKGLERRRAGKK